MAGVGGRGVRRRCCRFFLSSQYLWTGSSLGCQVRRHRLVEKLSSDQGQGVKQRRESCHEESDGPGALRNTRVGWHSAGV